MRLSDFFSRIKNELLQMAEVEAVELNQNSRKITVTARFEALAAFSDITGLEGEICEKYRMNKAVILPRYNANLLSSEFLENLTEYISDENPVAMSVLAGATATLADGVFLITLKNNGHETLMQINCLEKAQEIIKEQFNADVKVDIVSQAETFEEYEKVKEQAIKRVEEINSLKPKEENPIILGREIKTDNYQPIKEINETSGRVVISGEVFSKNIDYRETRDGKYIVSFDITDFEGSITCKL